MPRIYLCEQEVGGPATGVAYPNLRSCIGITAVLTNQTLVGGHFTAQDDINSLTARMTATIGGVAISCLYLIGGYTVAGNVHGGPRNAHANAVAQALGFHGLARSYDTAALGYDASLILLEDAEINGDVRVQYKNWNKLETIPATMPGAHPYAPRAVAIIVVGVRRKPKWYNDNPGLILHELPLNNFTHLIV